MTTQISTKSRRLATGIRNYLSDLWARREFAWYMALGNLKARNASTSLGLLWWVLNPLLLGMVYWIVFGVIMPVSRDLSFLLSGMFVFYFTGTSITGGANSIISNSRLLANVSFPRLILPITAITEASVGFLASLIALYVIIGPTGGHWPGMYTILILPVAFAIQVVFNLGAGSLAARIAVPFRDVNNLIPYILRLWLYLSPIIYGLEFVDRLSAPWNTIYYLNPMVPMLSVYRSALLGYDLEIYAVVTAAAWAVGIAIVGFASFIKYEGKMARYL